MSEFQTNPWPFIIAAFGIFWILLLSFAVSCFLQFRKHQKSFVVLTKKTE
jgi:hypothetical protein